ncbi:MAG: cupin domain-containing protein [Pirellula sp.]|nr:cupin domain-containing protein [Pirellula sp.]
MDYKDISELIAYTAGGVTSKVLFGSKSTNTTLFCMAAKTEIGTHTSTKEGIVYVLEGDGVFTLKGKDIAMKQGVLIHMVKNAKHSLKAIPRRSRILRSGQPWPLGTSEPFRNSENDSSTRTGPSPNGWELWKFS